MTDSDLRRLLPVEPALLDRLVEVPFPGVEEVRAQLARALVRRIDDDGSLEIVTPPDVAVAQVTHRIPVEGESVDADGVPVYVLLHVVDGRASEFEIYKADSSPLQARPTPDTLSVWASDSQPTSD